MPGIGLRGLTVRRLGKLRPRLPHGLPFGALRERVGKRQGRQPQRHGQREEQKQKEPGLARDIPGGHLACIKHAGMGIGIRMLQRKHGAGMLRASKFEGGRKPLFQRQARFGKPGGIHRRKRGPGRSIRAQAAACDGQNEKQWEKKQSARQHIGTGKNSQEDVQGQCADQPAHAPAYPALVTHFLGDPGQRIAQRVLLFRLPARLQRRHGLPLFLKIGLLYQGGNGFRGAARRACAGAEEGV